jgi:hypothetical protein
MVQAALACDHGGARACRHAIRCQYRLHKEGPHDQPWGQVLGTGAGASGFGEGASRGVKETGKRALVQGIRDGKPISGDARALHGKEGVDGSSPSEGLKESPANGHVVLPVMARFGFFAGTRRVHFGTGGHSRARSTSRDTALTVLETVHRDHSLEKFLQTGGRRCPRWRDADSLLR